MSSRDPKQVILDAALAVFAKVGFDRATTAQIQARAGISNGALFHHFPSKETIAEALYLRGLAAYQSGLVKALEQHSGAKAARATIRAAVQHHLAWVEANRDLAWFMYERGRPDWQPAHGSEVRKLNRATAGHIRDWMAPLVKTGIVRDLPLTALAALVNGPAHFVARRWLSGLTTQRPTSFTDILADAAWVAIAPHRKRPSPTPLPQLSLSGLIETAALDAASSISPPLPRGAWSVVQLAMNGSAQTVPVRAKAASVRSIRNDGDGRLVTIEIDVVDADGSVTAYGSVICLWRDSETSTE
ncbi:TetR/AcrR family transcriptional regulator [Bradyrhizobium sp. ARR65]|uniref:TetR/AcrR family transcriptional regulator n=1 Tax=Bradyrhizobium sp. ARR65 TaxID=1040989 RepID=UPI0018DB9DC0|nr:TetR/AcrR family transcriptional regulator [Bradyrhizobium sp. ARR65]